MINELYAELSPRQPKPKDNLIGTVISLTPLRVQTSDIILEEANLYKARTLFYEWKDIVYLESDINDADLQKTEYFKKLLLKVGDTVLLIPAGSKFVVSEVLL